VAADDDDSEELAHLAGNIAAETASRGRGDMDKITYLPAVEALNRDYPAWEAWVGLINGLWHARLKGATPPVMVHGDSAQDIREQIEQIESKSYIA
jgi:hypothetical protein